ncbi:DUF3906 family protein [Bacillus sp. 165]|uniref:DUF3906 family protein n=1 Tax=Bacillus sp. 165 TaxID=1529117 RepID=UPI001ADB1F73|nr:DUF3906 family protein [Bacillus sp. 165]MBO9128341.1 DUF3906 family protein [Bacillus sp. 165]
MGLYRFEVLIQGEVVHVVIVAENEELAFQLVDIELEKYFLKMPEAQEITLYEVKKIRKSGGFVIQR